MNKTKLSSVDRLELSLYTVSNNTFLYESSTGYNIYPKEFHHIVGDYTAVSVCCKVDEEKEWKKKLYNDLFIKIRANKEKLIEYASRAEKQMVALSQEISNLD